MRGTIIRRFRQGARKLLRDQRGNAMFLTAAAVVPLIGFVGSAVDIGRAYMAELRLQQACDAGVLAGRRAMAGGTYDSVAQAEADKMFNFNYPTDSYGSHDVGFTSEASGASDVTGTASAILPTALMYIFGKSEFDLSVNCTAKLEISNVDVMLVLDVTGSMSRANGDDTVTKIEGLRTAAIDFFGTLTDADIGDGRLRFGVVPYSSSVNVGGILMAKNPDWLADKEWLPSRKPVTKEIWGDARTVDPTEYTKTDPVPDRDWRGNDDWEDAGKVDKSESDCVDWDTSASPRIIDSEDLNVQNPVIDGSTRITESDQKRTYEYYSYDASWQPATRKRPGSCQIKRLRWTFTRTYYKVQTTETLTRVFDGAYTYLDREFDTLPLKTGSTIESDTGFEGATVTTSWAGCIIERATTKFAANETAPSNALDMDIDTPPSAGDSDTQWKLFLPDITYDRGQEARFNSSTNRKNFVQKGGDYAACPVPAMNLTEMTKDDAGTFAAYINALQPKGYTYHDAGMAWGARLMSPTGLFAAENATATNGRPISRHIIFMTDGDMMTPRSNLSHQGQESSMPRIGATSDDDAIARHNNRFVQLCKAARDRGITIWVVSFGVGSNSNLNKCASSGAAYEADDSKELNEKFQSIARQISKLRLSR